MHHLIQRIKDRRRAKELLRQYDIEEIADNLNKSVVEWVYMFPARRLKTWTDLLARYISAHRNLCGTEFTIEITHPEELLLPLTDEEEYDH